MASLTPPWANDNSPRQWVKLSVAAVVFYRKHHTYLRKLAARGDLPGAVRYGRNWWVKLPPDFHPSKAYGFFGNSSQSTATNRA